MVYVFRRRNSDSARELTDALQGDRLKIYNNGAFQRREGGMIVRPRRGDSIVCWGEELPEIVGVKILNNAPIVDKKAAALKLKAAGVATIEVADQRPVTRPAAPLLYRLSGGDINKVGARELLRSLSIFIATPDPVPQNVGEWLPRTANHMGGHDLLTPPSTPDYWVKKEKLIEEYRVHIFNGKSIKAGVKGPRDGVVTPNAWIRSYDAGWGIHYSGFSSTKKMRALAVKAVEALGLQFGAVDLGKRDDGTLIVLEVNRAPGLDGGTVNSYATAIQEWLEA